jgi:hypothetical protein
MREHEQEESEQRYDGEENIISQSSREQQALVFVKGVQNLQAKATRLGHDLPQDSLLAMHLEPPPFQ